MATRPGPARWYLAIGRDSQRAHELRDDALREYLHRARETRRIKLTEQVRELRHVFKGFDPADGYDLHNLKSWPAARAQHVEKYGEYLRHLTSQPHEILRPRNKKQKKSLETFTGQHLPKQKAYVVHKSTDEETVHIDRQGMISIERELPEEKGIIKSDFYLFLPLLGYQPTTWDDVYAATLELMPYLPDGKYLIYSELHGEIDAPHEKRMLPRLLMRYMQEYHEKNFAQTILGFKRLSSQIEPNEEYRKRYERRQKRAEQKKKNWQALQAQVRRRLAKEQFKALTRKRNY